MFKQWQTRGLIPADDQPGPTEAHRTAVVEYENAEYLQQQEAWVKAGQPPWYGPAKSAMKKAEKRKAIVTSLLIHLTYTSQGLTNSIHVAPNVKELGYKLEEELNRRMEELSRRMEELRRQEHEERKRWEKEQEEKNYRTGYSPETTHSTEERRQADEAHNDIMTERKRTEEEYQERMVQRRQEDERFQVMMADRQQRQRREQEEQRTQRWEESQRTRTNYSPDKDYSKGPTNEDDNDRAHSVTSKHSVYRNLQPQAPQYLQQQTPVYLPTQVQHKHHSIFNSKHLCIFLPKYIFNSKHLCIFLPKYSRKHRYTPHTAATKGTMERKATIKRKKG
ncbi:hypothetical protein F7725_019208 [Dissostichus mawsoni]|uniref:Uncharacterized protein n=1 Tax=Dissostichus mawsoni TaxID=36200 RepID=A0A7J5YL74_DISMA|nr:hypothetical protein F7725_019208 [Dissostichus mawsoni]